MPTNKEAAVLLQQSVKRLQKYTVEDIELALYELSCQREECLRTFIDCNKNFKRLCRFEKELKKQTEMAQVKEEASRKMAAEYKKISTENEKLRAENQALRTKNEELTQEKQQQMIQRSTDDERARKCRSPLQGRQLSPAADTVVTSTSTSTPSNSKSGIIKKPWTPVLKKKRRLLNEEIFQEQQQQENLNTMKAISGKNAHPVDLANSNANAVAATIVADDELALAQLEIVIKEEEENENEKEKEKDDHDHPIINTVLSQQAFSSPNGTATTTSTMMMTEVNEHHDSGFMENAINKQQEDADDADVKRVISYPHPHPPPPPASPPPSPPPPPPPPLSVPLSPATATHPFEGIFALKFCHFLTPFTELIHNYQAFNLEAAIDVFCRYNNNDFENISPQEMENLKGVLRQIAILDIEAKKTKQIKEEPATSHMDDF